MNKGGKEVPGLSSSFLTWYHLYQGKGIREKLRNKYAGELAASTGTSCHTGWEKASLSFTFSKHSMPGLLIWVLMSI
jgi:hypothetical protein